MEPADLNSPTSHKDDARLEAMLRRAAPALSDNGFSARVLAALPEPKVNRIPWLRIALCIAGAFAGCSLALWRGAAWPDLESSAERFAAVLANVGPVLVDPWVGAAVGVTVLSLLVAFRTELQDRLRS